MRTIIQTIGPLYGEAVNGSVFGQPNGSEARPRPNVPSSVTLSGNSGTLTFTGRSGGQFAKYELAGISAAIVDSGTAVRIKSRFTNANGVLFATGGGKISEGATIGTYVRGHADSNMPADGEQITISAELIDSYGNVIATSNTLTLTAVVPE